MIDKDVLETLIEFNIDIKELKDKYEETIVKVREEWLMNCLKEDIGLGLPYLVAYLNYDNSGVKFQINWTYNIKQIETMEDEIKLEIIEPAQAMISKQWLEKDPYYLKTKQITDRVLRDYYNKFPLIICRFSNLITDLTEELKSKYF